MYFHISYDSFGASNALFLSYNVTLLLRNFASSASKIIYRKYKNNFGYLLNKLFGMKYDACGRVSTYAILNNINRNEQFDRYGNSQNLSNGNGDNVMDKWGLAYNYDHPRGTYSVDGTADIAYGDTYTNTKTASTAFLQGGDVYSRVLNTNNLYSVDASTRHRFYFFGNSKYDFSISPSVHYKTNHGNLSMLSATFNADVDSLLGKAWDDSLRMKNPGMALLQHGIIRQIQSRKNEGYLLEADIRADKDIAIPHTYNYGVQCSFNVELLHNLQLETSLVSIGIRGFNASDMNVDEYIWSANVKKMFGERWGVNLEVFDILGQRKDVYTFVNGQGRSEYFSNNLKRYAMVHVLFKLNPRR